MTPEYKPWETNPAAKSKPNGKIWETVCPKCGTDTVKAEVLASRGWYERTDLMLCKCGQKFENYG